jgi:hypothetical protein
MDFVEGLLVLKGKDFIMMIAEAEKFTKYIHFIALSLPFTA